MQVNSTPVISSPIFIASILLSLALCYFAFFWQLETQPLLQWDEARLAVNAYEMAESGNILVTTFDGEPDMWNTKPPLMIWAQALFVKLFGVNVLSIRLPSALAALSTALMLFFFCTYYLKNIIAGLLAVGVLASTEGYITYHVARHGDYDALLIFFMTAAALGFFIYTEHFQKKRYIYLSIFCMALAVLTKGIAGLIAAPAFFLFVLYRKNLIHILKDRHFYFSILIFIFLVFGYYFLRETIHEGYIEAVLNNEIFGRYNKTIEGHSGGFWFYLEQMYENQFRPWIIFLPLLLIMIRRERNLDNHLIIFILLYIVSYYTIISLSETKTYWYIAPVYPIAALGIGLLISNTLAHFNISNVKALAFTILLLIIPYWNIIHKIEENFLPGDPSVYFGKYIEKLNDQNPEVKKYIAIQNVYNASLLFYTYKYEKEGINIIIDSINNFSSEYNNEPILICNPALQQQLEDKYPVRVIDQYFSCKSYLLINN